jgi:hypothetical protein
VLIKKTKQSKNKMSDSSGYQPKSGDISIFQNEKRTKKEQPLLTGKVFLNLKELEASADQDGNITLWLALWGKQPKNGGKDFWSGKCTVPTARQEENTTTAMPPAENGEVSGPATPAHTVGVGEDDLPF